MRQDGKGNSSFGAQNAKHLNKTLGGVKPQVKTMNAEGNPQSYLQKIIGILTQPNKTLAAIELKPGESIVTVTILYITVLVQGILELNDLGERNRISWLIIGTGFGLATAWFGLTFLYHFVARLFGGSGKYGITLLLMGYISVPMIFTSLLSLAIYISLPLIKPEWSGSEEIRIHTVIGWIGMIWSWPGILCYYVLRYGERLSGRSAGIIVGIVILVTISGWFLPVILRIASYIRHMVY